MVYVRDVRIRFTTNADKSSVKVDRLAKSIRRTETGWSHYLSTVKRVLIGMATFKIVMTSYFALTRFSAQLFEVNSLLEQTRVKLTFMGRSADYARQRIEAMKRITVTTSLTMQQLAASATIFSGFGLDLNKKWMRAMADTVAITGISTEKLALMIGKASVGMKQTINRSFGQIGISPAKLKSEYAKVHNWAKAVYNVMTQQFGGASKAVQNSFYQVITNLEDRFSFISARLGRGIFNIVRAHGQMISDMMDKLSKSNALDIWSRNIAATYSFIASASKQLVVYMMGLWHKYGQDLVTTIRDTATFMLSIFSVNGTVGIALAYFFKSLIIKLSKLSLVIDALRLMRDVFTGNVEQLKKDAELMGASVMAMGNKIKAGIGGVATTALLGIRKLIEYNWPGKTGALNIMDKLIGKTQKANAGFKQSANYYRGYVQALKAQGGISMLADLFSEVNDQLMTSGKGSDTLINKIKELAAAALNAASSVKDFNLTGKFAPAFKSLTLTTEQLQSFTRNISFLKTVFGGIESALAGINKQTKVWKSLLNGVMNSIKQLIAKMITLSLIYGVMKLFGLGVPGLGFGAFMKNQMFGIPLQELYNPPVIENKGLQMFPGLNTPTGNMSAAPIQYSVVINGDVYGYDDFADKVTKVFKDLT